MKFLLLLSLLFYFSCSSSYEVASQEKGKKKYKGKGESVIVKNVEQARKDSIILALKDALQKGIGVYISSTSEVQDGQSVVSKILAESEGYIEEYTITKDEKSGGLYLIELEASVNEDKIKNSFSGRMDKIVSKTPFGPCSLVLQAFADIKLYEATVVCLVNDPTIESSSVEVFFSSKKWEKPTVEKIGISYILKFIWKDSELIKQKDVIVNLLQNNKVSFKFIDPTKKGSKTTDSELYKIDYWKLGSGDANEEGSALEIKKENQTKLMKIKDSFIQATTSYGNFNGYCNINIEVDKQKEADDSSYLFNWICFVNDSMKKKMELDLPVSGKLKNLNNLKPTLENPFSYFDSADSFVLNCRDSKKTGFLCAKNALTFMDKPYLPFISESTSGKIEIRIINCSIRMEENFYSKENLSIKNLIAIRDCKRNLTKAIE